MFHIAFEIVKHSSFFASGWSLSKEMGLCLKIASSFYRMVQRVRDLCRYLYWDFLNSAQLNTNIDRKSWIPSKSIDEDPST